MQRDKPRKVLLILSALNLLGLMVLWPLENLTPEKLWPIALLVFAPQFIFVLPAIAIGFLCWKRKQPRLILLQIPALVLWWFGFSGFNLPLGTDSAPPAPIRVMTYNIRYGSLGIDNVVATIHRQDPDILCVQEALPKENLPDPMPALTRGLRSYHRARYGELVIFSKFPISSWKRHALPRHNGSGVLEAKLDINGKPFTVYCAHFINPIDGRVANWAREISTRATIRRDQLDLLLRLADKTPHPFFAAGDFNTPPRGILYRHLHSKLTDSWRRSGWGTGHTFWASLPLNRIDYFWTAPGTRITNCQVVHSYASDHKPLVGRLVF